MTRAVLMEDYMDHARHLGCVREFARRVDLRIYTDKAQSEDELARRLEGAEIAITIRDRVLFPASLLSRLPSLRLISVCGPRLEPHIDLPAATRAGILVCRGPSTEVPQDIHRVTAELAWSLILGLAKGCLENHAALRAGGWQTRLPVGLAGRTLGVIGMGKVGAPVARIGLAMGMRVLAWSPRFTPQRAAQHGVEAAPSLASLLRESDVVSLHANATPESRGMIGAAEFSAMRPGAFFINTARAALVDEEALREALARRSIAGAGLDVYWQEPLPAGHWLRRQDNVLLLPHLGAFTHEGHEWLIGPAVEAATAYLDGRPINVANPEVAARGMTR